MLQLRGLIAATFTPMHANGSLALEQIPPMVDALLRDGVSALYVVGSTGEGPSLMTSERKRVAEAFVEAAASRVPVVVQVGHNSLADAAELAAHSAEIGADAISATPPSYFRPATLDDLIACMRQVADAAPQLPFYYYHIPMRTGVEVDLVAFSAARGRDPELARHQIHVAARRSVAECRCRRRRTIRIAVRL